MNLQVLSSIDGSVVDSFNVKSELSSCSSQDLELVSSYLFKSKKISFNPTASTKGISDVSGTSKKPYKQKGTGSARQGSLRSPQFRGGGIIFGPLPIKKKVSINSSDKAVVKSILLSLLLSRSLSRIVDGISCLDGKAKSVRLMLSRLGIDIRKPRSKTILICSDNELTNSVLRSVSNFLNVSVSNASSFEVFKVVQSDEVVFTKLALDDLVSRLL
jgi:large subunit ribosomal protein L4